MLRTGNCRVFKRCFSIDEVVKAIVHPHRALPPKLPLSKLLIPPDTVVYPEFKLPENPQSEEPISEEMQPKKKKKKRSDVDLELAPSRKETNQWNYELMKYLVNTRPQISINRHYSWLSKQIDRWESLPKEIRPSDALQFRQYIVEDSKTESMAIEWKSLWQIINKDKFPAKLYSSFSAVKLTPTELVHPFEIPAVSNQDMVETDKSDQLYTLGKLFMDAYSSEERRMQLNNQKNINHLTVFNFGNNNLIGLKRTLGLLSLETPHSELKEWLDNFIVVSKLWERGSLYAETKKTNQFPELPPLLLEGDLISKLGLIPAHEVDKIGEEFLNYVAIKNMATAHKAIIETFKNTVLNYINTQLEKQGVKFPFETSNTALVFIALQAIESPDVAEEFLKDFLNVPEYDQWIERIKWTAYDHKLPVYHLNGIEDITSIYRLPPLPRTNSASILMTNCATLKIRSPDLSVKRKKNRAKKMTPQREAAMAFENLCQDAYALGRSNYEFNIRASLIKNLSIHGIESQFSRLLHLFRHPLFYRHVTRLQFERIDVVKYRKALIVRRFEPNLIPSQFMQIMAILTLYGNQVPHWVNQFVPIMTELYETLPEPQTEQLNKELYEEFKREQAPWSKWYLERLSRTKSMQVSKFKKSWKNFETTSSILNASRLELLGKLYWDVLALIISMRLGISGFIESKNEINGFVESHLPNVYDKTGSRIINSDKDCLKMKHFLGVDSSVGSLLEECTDILETMLDVKMKPFIPLFPAEFAKENTIDHTLDNSEIDLLAVPVIYYKGKIPSFSKLLQVNYSVSREYLLAITSASVKECQEFGDIISKMSSFGELYLNYTLQKKLINSSDEVYGAIMSMFKDKQFRTLVVDHSPAYSLESEKYVPLRVRQTHNHYLKLKYYNWQFRQIIANFVYYDPAGFDKWIDRLLLNITSGKFEPDGGNLSDEDQLKHIAAFRTAHYLEDRTTTVG